MGLFLAIFLPTCCQIKNEIVFFSSSIIFSSIKSDNDKFDVNQSSHSPSTLHIRWLPKSLLLDLKLIPSAKSTAFSQSLHKEEDCGIYYSKLASYAPLWSKLRSHWNVLGKEACCSLVITFDVLIIPSKWRIFHSRYLFCLYWRLLWSIPT